jgi:hypothetical protein
MTRIYGIILTGTRRSGNQKARNKCSAYLEAKRVVFLQRHKEGPQNLKKKWLF